MSHGKLKIVDARRVERMLCSVDFLDVLVEYSIQHVVQARWIYMV